MDRLSNGRAAKLWTVCQINEQQNYCMARLSNKRAAKLWPDCQMDELQNNGQPVK